MKKRKIKFDEHMRIGISKDVKCRFLAIVGDRYPDVIRELIYAYIQKYEMINKLEMAKREKYSKSDIES